MKSSLEEENLSNATAAAYMNETTKKVRRVLDRKYLVKKTLNEEEATAIGGEVAEVPVEDEHHARDANISMKYLIKDHDCNIYS